MGAQPLTAMAQDAGLASNQFTQMDVVNTEWTIAQDIPDTYKPVAENDLIKLYVDETTLAFKVVDKRSGYVWHSTIDKKAGTDRLNKSWTAFAQSGISIEYLDQKAVNKRISVSNSTHTIDVKQIEQGFQATLTFTDFGISMDVILKLEPNGISVEVPTSSIKEESPDFKLGLIYVYPFMGATRVDSVPGYMLIPDGSGSLIRFSATTNAKNMLYGKYYGPDLGMITSLPYDSTLSLAFKVSVPVFGMLHGYKQNAFISIVEKGAAYGELHVHPAGVITNFNFIYNAFIYNQSYFQATNRSGDGVTILQKKTNQFDIKVHYRFLTKDDSDYVGMARSYQQYLTEAGVLKKISNPDANIGVKLEFLGAEKEKFLLWDQAIPMTTVNQMADILKDLALARTDVVYYGWQPRGASNMPPKSFNLEGSLGSASQLRALIEKVKAGGGNFYLYHDPQAALKGEGGYSARNELAMSITNANLLGYNRGKLNYYFNLDTLRQNYTSLSKDVFNNLKAGLALDGISTMLYSDFKNGHLLTREEAIKAYQELLASNPVGSALYTPNDYLFGLMQAYYDMPLSSSGYLFTTDTVPFLQIVFAGYVPYYGPALNFSSNAKMDLLRQVDYGAYPAYFLTNDVTAKILNTKSNWIYTSSYKQWSQEIKQTYQWLNNLLGPVSGQTIVARQVLVEGVVAVTYSNHKQIIVNYSNQPYSAGDMVVSSQDAALREVLP